jgi:hypothetical protein
MYINSKWFIIKSVGSTSGCVSNASDSGRDTVVAGRDVVLLGDANCDRRSEMGVAGRAPAAEPGRAANGDDGGRPTAEGGRGSGDAGAFRDGATGEVTGEGTGDRPCNSSCKGCAAPGEVGNDRVGCFWPGLEFGGVDRAPLSLLLAVDGRLANRSSRYA